MQSYFKVPKEVKLNTTHFFYYENSKQKRTLDIDFISIYKKCTVKPYSFLVNDTTLPSDNHLFFRKIF